MAKTTRKNYVLTFDSPASPKKYVNIDLKAAAAQVDFLIIDGYDYAGTGDKQTNESSSLYDTPADPVYADAGYIDATVRAYLKAGVPPAKYTMGLPLYAVGWTGDWRFSSSAGRRFRSVPEPGQSYRFAGM